MDGKKITICLLGSIPKGNEIRRNWIDWKSEYKKTLSSIKNIKFVDGDYFKDETQPFKVFGHDSYLIKSSDIIIVNAEAKLGAGTSQEILIAKYFKKPVITILPKNTHHRKSNITFDDNLIEDWIHPFILTTSDAIVENIKEAKTSIEKFLTDPGNIKDITIIDQAIEAYLKTK